MKKQNVLNLIKYHVEKNENAFRNAKLVHPIHQRHVYEIIKELRKYKSVKKIIIFGSSVTKRCTYESDIDLYVELLKEERVQSYLVDCPVDFWTNYTVLKDFLGEILKTGVVVYKRRA